MKKIALFFILILILSCNTQMGNSYNEEVIYDSEIIDFTEILENPDYYSYGDISEKIQIIQLETNPNSLISGINKIIVGNEYIYIHDRYRNGGVTIFGIDGKFKCRLPHGQGAGELVVAGKIFLDRDSQSLYVYDEGKKSIEQFDKTGHHISTTYTTDLIDDFVVCDNAFLSIQPSCQNIDNVFSLTKADSSYSIISKWSLGKEYFYRVWPNNMQLYDNGVYFLKGFDDNIYYYKNDTVYKRYTLVNQKEEKYEYKNCKNNPILDKSVPNDVYYFEGTYMETNKYQFFKYTSSQYLLCIQRDKATKRLSIWRNKKNSLEGFITICNINDGNDNTISAYIESYQFAGDIVPEEYRWDGSNPNNLISPEDMEKLRNVKPDDNPIIVLFKLKDDI